MTAEEIQIRALGIALGDVHWKAPDGSHVGVWEEWGSNRGPRVNAMLEAAGVAPGAPWCMGAVFLWTREACEQFGIPHPLAAVRLKALVQSVVDWAIEERRVIGRGDRIPGDIACFSFGSKRYDHVGLVRIADPLEVVEGNTFLADGDDDAPGQRGEREGYEVEVKPRELSYRKPTLFIRWADLPAGVSVVTS